MSVICPAGGALRHEGNTLDMHRKKQQTGEWMHEMSGLFSVWLCLWLLD